MWENGCVICGFGLFAQSAGTLGDSWFLLTKNAVTVVTTGFTQPDGP